MKFPYLTQTTPFELLQFRTYGHSLLLLHQTAATATLEKHVFCKLRANNMINQAKISPEWKFHRNFHFYCPNEFRVIVVGAVYLRPLSISINFTYHLRAKGCQTITVSIEHHHHRGRSCGHNTAILNHPARHIIRSITIFRAFTPTVGLSVSQSARASVSIVQGATACRDSQHIASQRKRNEEMIADRQ